MRNMILLFTLFFTGNAFPNTLEQLWDLAEKNSPGIKARLKNVQSMELSIEGLPKWYMPKAWAEFGYSGAHNFVGKTDNNSMHGPLGRLAAEWTIWDGGRTYYSKKALEKRAHTEIWKQAQLKIDLKHRVSMMYIRIAHLNEIIDQLEKEKMQYKKLATLFRPQLRIGRIGRSSIVEVNIQIENLQSEIDAKLRFVELLKEQLTSFIGTKEVPKIEKLAKLIEELNEHSEIPKMNIIPFFKFAKAEIEALKAEKEWAKRELFYPSLSIRTHAGYGPRLDALQPNQPELGADIRFSIPIFSRGDRFAQLSSREKSIEATELDFKQQLLQFRTKYNIKKGKSMQLKKQIKKNIVLISALSKNLNLSYREISRGVKSPLEIFSSIIALYDLKSSLADFQLELLGIETEFRLFILHAKNLE